MDTCSAVYLLQKEITSIMLSLGAMRWLASPQNGWKLENISNSKGLYSMTIDAAEAGATREELSEAIVDSFNDEFKLAVSRALRDKVGELRDRSPEAVSDSLSIRIRKALRDYKNVDRSYKLLSRVLKSLQLYAPGSKRKRGRKTDRKAQPG